MGISTLSDEVDIILRDLALSDDLEKLVDAEGASVWADPWADWALTMSQNLRSRITGISPIAEPFTIPDYSS